MQRAGVAVWVLLLAVPGTGAGQDDPPGSTLIPLPVIFYQPETGTGFGAAVTYYFRPGGATTVIPPSEIGVVGIYTARKQIITSISTSLYLARGRTRVRGEISYLRFPTKFWGIGNDTPETDEEDYTPETVTLSGELQRMVAPGWFLGGTGRAARRVIAETAAGGTLASGTAPGTADGRAVEIGALLTRDTRTSTVYPRGGTYHRLRIDVADRLVGSDFEFARVTLDLRQYFAVLESHVMALRAYGEVMTGTPPFDFLPQLGGDRLLRGYYTGRYRDRSLAAAQLEYRLPVWWRFGLVGFAGGGRVAPDLAALAEGSVKFTAGAGLRFQLSRQENLNIRADFGWGFDVGTGGFYLSLGEAF